MDDQRRQAREGRAEAAPAALVARAERARDALAEPGAAAVAVAARAEAPERVASGAAALRIEWLCVVETSFDSPMHGLRVATLLLFGALSMVGVVRLADDVPGVLQEEIIPQELDEHWKMRIATEINRTLEEQSKAVCFDPSQGHNEQEREKTQKATREEERQPVCPNKKVQPFPRPLAFVSIITGWGIFFEMCSWCFD